MPKWLIDAHKKEGPFYFNQLDNTHTPNISNESLGLKPGIYYMGELKNHKPHGAGILFSHKESHLTEGYFEHGFIQGYYRLFK